MFTFEGRWSNFLCILNFYKAFLGKRRMLCRAYDIYKCLSVKLSSEMCKLKEFSLTKVLQNRLKTAVVSISYQNFVFIIFLQPNLYMHRTIVATFDVYPNINGQYAIISKLSSIFGGTQFVRQALHLRFKCTIIAAHALQLCCIGYIRNNLVSPLKM